MLFQREFLEDSDSSFEAQEEDVTDQRFYTQEEAYYPTPNYEVPPAYSRSASISIQKTPTQYREVSPPYTSKYTYDEEPAQYRDASPQFYGNTQYRDTSSHQAPSSSHREQPPRQYSQNSNPQPYSQSTYREATPQTSSRVQYESDTRQYGRSSHRDPIPQFNTHYRDTSPQPTQYRDTSPQPTQYRDTSPQPTQYREVSPQPTQYREVSPQPTQYRDTSPQPYTQYRDTSPQPYTQHRDISPPPYPNARRFETENYDPRSQASYHKPQDQFQSKYSATPTSTTPRGDYQSRFPEEAELQRPPTQSGRPITASAQMRQRMMEQQKNKLTQRKETSTMQVSSNSNYTALNSIIYSNGILGEQDLKSNKELKGFAAPDYKFEPTTFKMRETEKLPGPIKVERTVFKDELEVEVLHEAKAVRNPNPVTPREVNIVKEIPVEKKELRNQPVVIEESIPVAYTPPVVQSVPPPYNPNKDFPTSRDSESPHHSRPSPVPERSIPQPKSYIPHEESDLNTNQPKQSPDKYPPPRPSYSDHQAEAQVTSNRFPAGIQTDTDPLPSPTKGIMELPPQSVPEAPTREQDLYPSPPPEQVFQILQHEMRDMKRFLKRPLPKGIMLECTISRKKGGLARLYPKYYMHISNNNTFLLAGKKRANNRTSNYLISMEKDALSVKSPFYMGKVRSNFMGTRFTLYDIGLNPKHKGANAMNAREELGVIYYVTYISGIQHLWTERP
jgi:hypothetical protein